MAKRFFPGFLNTMENLSLLDDRFWSLVGIDVDRWRLTKSSALLIRLPVLWLAERCSSTAYAAVGRQPIPTKV